jgi:SWI/SNF-related matrix-associated actin-dependent regulator of chromatin subfamily A-like protein 1
MERSQELFVENPYRRIGTGGVEPNDGRDRKELQITKDKHPLLSKLVSKLRPFQREALEFAVLGRQYQRQFTVNDTDTSTSGDGDGKTAAVSSTDLPEDDHASSLLGIGRILLADEMGLGKTVTSLAIMAYYHAEWPLLVVCPASLRYQWPAEIERFFPSLPPSATYVCTGFQDIGFLKGNQVKQDVKIVVVTYSLFQQRSAVAHAVEAANFQCVIVDESHNLKQKDSQRTALLLPLLQRAHRLVLLSGTPALARPVELWTSLYALAPKVFGTWSAFTNRYCNVTRKHIGRGRFAIDYSGASNVEELNRKLRLIMVRRLKSVVLTELPPKQRTVIQTCVSNDRLKSCKEAIERWQSAPKDDNFEGQAAMMLAYQETGIGKASAVADYVSSVWLPGCQDKILVFAHHTAVLDTIEESINRNNKAVGHIRIDGSVPASLRAREVRKFQNNTNCRVALLSITAAGVGLTLTAASTVLFAELHWTPGILAQAEDRAHRIGQTASQVHIIYMIDKNKKQSIDSTLWNMLGRKISTVDKVVDGKQVRIVHTARASTHRCM